ncbi:reverse transcriptase domain, reverse transcriptase zinc-binding domain protein, partial [Tanacetum coccineum]
MFRVVKKLKLLKKPFRKLLYEKGNLHANVIRLRKELDSVQTMLDVDPFNVQLCESEVVCVVEFNQAAIMEERSRIDVVTNMKGIFENDKVPEEFVSHYEMFLGLAGETHDFNTLNLFKTCLNEQVALDMVREVSKQEVKEAMFSIGDDKSPGPDGYLAAFFKEAWEIVGDDVTNAICEFFTNGTLLKELNHTIIALIPKIIANRIKQSLKDLVSPNQSAFISGRSISDNILLTQELMHNYHLDGGTPRCAFKVDFQKAYEMVDWHFVREVLHGSGFHPHVQSATVIKEALEEFKLVSGLVPSLPKSTAYLCNVLNHIKISILHILPFEEGRLPVKHVGVPLVSSRLRVRDCKELIEKVQTRVQDWKNKSLSIAGRLKLTLSVIGSMHIYWASVFMLPSQVLLDIEQF